MVSFILVNVMCTQHIKVTYSYSEINPEYGLLTRSSFYLAFYLSNDQFFAVS